MVSCPNRNRKKRVHKGGGVPGCQGHLQIVLLVPISLPMTRSARRSLDFDRVVGHAIKKRGIKIKPAQLEAAFMRGVDLVCDHCGWSYRRVLNGLKAESRRLSRARKLKRAS
jgi:hypothetical protein